MAHPTITPHAVQSHLTLDHHRTDLRPRRPEGALKAGGGGPDCVWREPAARATGRW